MKKIYTYLILIIVISSCQGQKKPQCLVDIEKKLAPKLNQEIVQGEIINFRDNIKCIEWDSLVVVMASNNKELIEKNSNFKIPYSLDEGNYFYNDNEVFVFFLKDNIAVNHIYISTACGKDQKCKTFNFFTLQKNLTNAFISKKDAVFEVYSKSMKDNRGNEWVQYNAIRIKKT